MRREFTLTHEVRYDECNCFGLLTPAAFLRFLQDITIRDVFLDAKLDCDGYFVTRRTRVSFKAPVKKFGDIELKSFGTGFGRVTAQLGYEVRPAGQPFAEPAISARTIWVYLGPQGRPERVPQKATEIWRPDVPEPSLSETPFPALPESVPATFTFTVRFSDLDPVMHMNNASIVEKLDNAAWEAYATKGITTATARMDPLFYDIEYMGSPLLGDRLEIQTWFSPSLAPGQAFSCYQQMTREGKVVARAHSRWLWKAEKWNGLANLYKKESQQEENRAVLVAL